MKLAIILVNRNGKRYFADLFSSLDKIDYPAPKVDIFFIDNNSTDNSLNQAKKQAKKLNFKIIFIKNKQNLGFSAGNNQALHKIIKSDKYKYAVLLNIDTKAEPGWLEQLVKIAEADNQIAAVQSLILLYNQPKRINTAGNKLHYLGFGWSGSYFKKMTNIKYQALDTSIGYASGAGVLYRVKTLCKIGLFDEKFFMYHEDLELSWRLRLAGYKIRLAPKSIVYHKYHFARHKKKWYWTERNRWLVYFTMYKLRTLILFAPVFLFIEAGVLVFSLLNGWFLYKLRAYLDFLMSIPYIIKKRQMIARLRQINDQEVIKQMEACLQFAQIKNPLIKKLVNPILEKYFSTVKLLIK